MHIDDRLLPSVDRCGSKSRGGCWWSNNRDGGFDSPTWLWCHMWFATACWLWGFELDVCKLFVKPYNHFFVILGLLQ